MDLPGTDFVGECVATHDGGVVVVTFLQNKIIKLDASGNLLWTYVIDTSGVQFLRGVTETEDHGIVAFGSVGSFSSTHVIKLDENGNRLWEKNFNVPGQTLTAQWVCPAHGDGGFLIGGGECALQFYVARCDSNGSIQWVQQFFGLTTAPTGFFSDMVQAPGSGYVATYSKLDNSDLDWGILKLDDNGGFVWAKALDEGAERDEVVDAVPTLAGGVAVLGTTTNYQAPNNENKMTLTTFDGSGNRLSYRVYDYTEQLQPRALTQVSDGGFVITGSTFSLTTLLVKTDILGAIQWQKVGNIATTQEGYGLAMAPNDMFYLSAGDFTHKTTVAKLSALTGQGVCAEAPIQLSTSSHQPPMLTPTGSSFAGAIVATPVNYPHYSETIQPTLVCGVLADEAPMPTATLQASPNPFSGNLHIDLGESLPSDGVLSLYDLSGARVAQIPVMAGTEKLDWELPALANGLLLLKLEGAGQSRTLKLVHTGK